MLSTKPHEKSDFRIIENTIELLKELPLIVVVRRFDCKYQSNL